MVVMLDLNWILVYFVFDQLAKVFLKLCWHLNNIDMTLGFEYHQHFDTTDPPNDWIEVYEAPFILSND